MAAAELQRPPAGELYLDHVAHFVPDLGVAAAVWEKLGLAVTPLSHHQVAGKPTGTSNRLVMFGEGYVELLAATSDTPHAQRLRDRMKRFVGVHLACFGTPSAEADHARLAAHGFDPEPLVRLEREIETRERVRFNVVYVPPDRMAEGRIQYCEHVTPDKVWRKGFVNEDFGLSAVYVVAEDPAEVAARWARFSALLPRRDGDLVELRCSRGRVVIGTGRSLSRLLGKVPSAPALAGYGLSCSNDFIDRCRKAGLSVNGRVVTLPPALGGAWLIDEAL